MKKRLYIVSNRIPVTLSEDLSSAKKSSGGLVAALDGLDGSEYDIRWIGWPGGEIAADLQPRAKDLLAEKHNATPVFLSADEQNDYYEGFSNSSLWPLLHYMPSRFRYDMKWWDAYRDVNQRFADAVLAVAGEDDLIWVHDYQLMLVPQMLRQARANLRIGFFLHTPFPSYEIFRCHPRREELVSGLLGADLVGFHTFGYMRHFRSCVLRLLGTDSEFGRIRHDGRTTRLGVYPIGINARGFEKELDSPAYAKRRSEMAADYHDRRVVLSVERLDYTKGILHRLEAIDLFLERRTPEERDRMKFIFIAIPTRGGVEEYQELREEVEASVGRLNGKYATLRDSPVRFLHGSVGFTDLTALYTLAEVCMVTPLIDGMNLVAKEYAACQRAGDTGNTDRPGESTGVLMLSEFAGAAVELHSAVVVNPYDVVAVADALEMSLDMPEEERRHRMAPMHERVTFYDAQRWAKSFIDELVAHDAAVEHFAPVDQAAQALKDAIGGGGKVALFLDYDGTLREIERVPSAATPTPAIHDLLKRLAGRKDVDVTIISGRRGEELAAWLGDYPFGLIAEHGAAFRRPGHAEWESLDRGVNYEWRDDIRLLLKLYAHATPGSTVEVKRTGLVWHYRQADPEFGEWQAKGLMEELSAVTANLPVQIRHGRKIVEVAAAEINKGAAVTRVLAEQRTENGIEYAAVLCAGDDVTDESMFQLESKNLLTVKIGEGDTHAHYCVPNPAKLRQFLSSVFE